MRKRHLKMELFAMILSFLLAMPVNLVSVAFAAEASTAKVKHKPPQEKYIPGFRIKLEAEIKDTKGVLLARCYFKTKKNKTFAFVDMLHLADSDYRAILPAPWLNSQAVEYVFVVVNEEKQVSRTQVFSIEEGETKEATKWKESGDIQEVRLDKAQDAAEQYKQMKKEIENKYHKERPRYQTETGEESMVVKSDLAVSRVDLYGFYDNAMLVEVPADLKYGLLAKDLYSPAAISGAGGSSAVSASTGGTAAGTIAATSGISTGTLIGIGAGVAILGGAAAVGSSSSSEDEEDAPPGTTPCNQTVQAGGDAPESHNINLAKKSGTFLFKWEMFGIKDRMTVVYQGNIIFDTGCVSGNGTKSITYSGNSQVVTVNVQPNCLGTTGTGWNFQVGCP